MSEGQLIDTKDLGWTPMQSWIIGRKITNLLRSRPFLHPDLTLFNPWADSRPFLFTTPYGTSVVGQAAPYPAAGSGPSVILSYTVPPALIAVIKKLAIVHIGGNPPDFQGNVIWQVTVNGAGIKGLNQQLSQIGTLAAPADEQIVAIENDIVQVLVTVPAGQVPPNGTTAASFTGWTYPLVEATYKRKKGIWYE